MPAAAEPIPLRAELLRQLVDLATPERRQSAITGLSALLGIDTFIVFLPDPQIGALLAANGFAQTLPDARAWRAFLEATQAHGRHRGVLPWPDPTALTPALGLVRDNVVLVLLGGSPAGEAVEQFASLVRLMSPGFAGERASLSHQAQMELARRGMQEASALAAGLDLARQEAQREIAARKVAERALHETKEKLAEANRDLEARVQERTERLRETIRDLEAFSYSVSHDMRAPLRAMQTYAKVLLEDAGEKLSPLERDYLQRIARAAERLDRLIIDVLRYSGLARTPVDLEPLDLHRILADLIEQYPTLQPAAADVTIVGRLPRVLGHEMLLAQSLSNLLTNAVKFVAPGVRPQVQLSSEEKDCQVRLWIKDNGIGIEPRHHQQIFVMFERIHGDSKFEGTGIGLAIVKRAMHRMGGDVGVESTPGHGSRFWVTLPRA